MTILLDIVQYSDFLMHTFLKTVSVSVVSFKYFFSEELLESARLNQWTPKEILNK